MDDFLAKPFQPRQLQDLLETWLVKANRTGGSFTAGSTGTATLPLNLDYLGWLENETADSEQLEFVKVLVETFLENAEQTLVKLREAVRDGDCNRLEVYSHSFKSNCSYLGAVPLETMCVRLETLARDGVLDHAPHLIDLLAAEVKRTERFLMSKGLYPSE